MNLNFLKKLHQNKNGQTIFEFLIISVTLIFISFFILDLIRYVCLKKEIEAIAYTITRKIAYAEFDLKKKFMLDNNKKIIDNKIKNDINNILKNFKLNTSFFNKNKINYLEQFDIRVYSKFITEESNLSSGVYLNIQTCFPILFYDYFQFFYFNFGSKKDNNRTCLGFFGKNINQISFISIRVSAYSPWPASSKIIEYGFDLPNNFDLIDKDLFQEIKNKFYNENINFKIKD